MMWYREAPNFVSIIAGSDIASRFSDPDMIISEHCEHSHVESQAADVVSTLKNINLMLQSSFCHILQLHDKYKL